MVTRMNRQRGWLGSMLLETSAIGVSKVRLLVADLTRSRTSASMAKSGQLAW